MHGYAIVCPGQGSQSGAMFDFAAADRRGDAVLQAFGAALSLDLVAQAHDGAREGAALFDNALAQPAMVAAALATWAVLQTQLPPPALYAGYSVGEVSAWACAGAWGPQRAAEVAATRARLMDRHAPAGCGMLAVHGLPVDALLSLAERTHLAIVNDSDHAVLAGADADLLAAQALLRARGAWTRRLPLRLPSHTPLLGAAAREFGVWLACGPVAEPGAPVLRGVDGRCCRRAADAAGALSSAIGQTIRWQDCMRAIVESGLRVVLELGPGRTLSEIFAQAHPGVAARSVSDFRSARGVADWLLRELS